MMEKIEVLSGKSCSLNLLKKCAMSSIGNWSFSRKDEAEGYKSYQWLNNLLNC